VPFPARNAGCVCSRLGEVSQKVGPSSHRRSRRRRWVVVAAVLVAVAVVAVAAVRVLGSNGSSSSSSGAKDTSTPLASLDLSGLPIAKSSPCSGLDEHDVTTALGGSVSASDRYDPGERVRLSRGLRDVSEEFGCTYRDTLGAEARVWVFAQPVRRSLASHLVRDARAEKGCRLVHHGPGFGTPSVTTACPVRRPRGRVVTVRGLYGDTWLTCQLTLPADTGADDPVRRTQRWCVSVVTGLGARG
jgi:hypothetical protein